VKTFMQCEIPSGAVWWGGGGVGYLLTVYQLDGVACDPREAGNLDVF
jgi:hypothetical protein